MFDLLLLSLIRGKTGPCVGIYSEIKSCPHARVPYKWSVLYVHVSKFAFSPRSAAPYAKRVDDAEEIALIFAQSKPVRAVDATENERTASTSSAAPPKT